VLRMHRPTARVRPTVRARLTMMFAAGTALALALAGTLFYLLLRANLRDSVDSDLRTRADVLTARLAEHADGAPAQVLAGGGSIAQVLTAGGRPVASSADVGGRPLLAGADLAAARTHPLWSQTDTVAGRTHLGAIRVYAVPVHPGGDPAATLVAVVGTPTRLTDRAEDRVRNVMVVATAPLVALAGAAAWLLSGAALRPVERMRREAAAMAAAEDAIPGSAPGARPTLPTAPELAVPATQDELAALARTMNDLLRRLHAARARDRAFVADAGHELRTPLTVLRAELELAGRPGRSAAELRDAVAGAFEETERLIRLTESLLTLARMDARHLLRVPVALDEVLDRAARAAAAHADTRGVRVVVDIVAADRPLTVLGDPDLLRQSVDNLLANAVRHAPAGSAVELHGHRLAGEGGPGAHGPGGRDPRTTGAGRGAGEQIVVRVRDHGAGFPGEFLPHAFERFRRADAARGRGDGGAGLGLAIVAAIVAAHDGTIEAANHPGGGALLTLTLPTTGPTAAPSA
jgi:two-component system OmpR family sensor kinase